MIDSTAYGTKQRRQSNDFNISVGQKSEKRSKKKIKMPKFNSSASNSIDEDSIFKKPYQNQIFNANSQEVTRRQREKLGSKSRKIEPMMRISESGILEPS